MSKRYTLQELLNICKTHDIPKEVLPFYNNQRFLEYKRNAEVKPILYWKDLHPYAKEAYKKVSELFGEDIYITGSWVNGTWSHPEDKPEYAKLRLKLGKSEISDLDFYVKTNNIKEARKKLWDIGDSLGLKLDYVNWWGTGINNKGELIACNDKNIIAGDIKKKYKNHYSDSELFKFEVFKHELSR